MNAHRRTHSANRLVPSVALVVISSGACMSLTGCGYHKASADQAQPTTAVAAKPDADASKQHSAPAHPTTTRGTNSARQARQFDPFWIEAAAEADRNIWMGNPVFADPLAHSATGGTILANQTIEFATPANPTGLAADTVEGLTHVTFASEGADFDPSLARDGTFMVFASTQHRSTADIYLKRVNGRTITQLTSDPAHDLMPAISPDGQRVAFASNRAGNWDLYVMASKGGQAVQLTSDSSQEVAPSWSPDGTKLVFSRFGEMSGRWEMWVMDVQASASAEFLGYGLFPKWCPKGATGSDGRDRVLFQRSRERGDRAFSLWTIDYKPGDASSPTEVASQPNAALINAEWSPDGDRIVYASVDNPGATGEARPGVSDLWMASIDGSSRVNLTSGKFMNLMPSWSKDGRIYFASNRGGATNLWSIGTDKAIYAATAGQPKTAAPETAITTTPPEHEAPANDNH